MPTSNLYDLLAKKAPTEARRERLLAACAEEMGIPTSEVASPTCVAYALLKLDIPDEVVTRALTWKEFEQLSAGLIRSSGFRVEEDVRLRKPRAQIDLVAYGTSVILAVDCKHWSRGHSQSSMKKFALDQLRRSAQLKRSIGDGRPIASVILSVSAPSGTFVEGVPIVPIRALGSFVSTLDSYSEYISFR